MDPIADDLKARIKDIVWEGIEKGYMICVETQPRVKHAPRMGDVILKVSVHPLRSVYNKDRE